MIIAAEEGVCTWARAMHVVGVGGSVPECAGGIEFNWEGWNVIGCGVTDGDTRGRYVDRLRVASCCLSAGGGDQLRSNKCNVRRGFGRIEFESDG